VRPGRS